MQRLGKMMLLHAPCSTFKVGNGARHAKHTVISARRSTEFLDRGSEPFALGLRQRAVTLEIDHAQVGVRLAGAKQRLLARIDDAATDRGAVVVMGAAWCSEIGDRYARYFDTEVDAIEKRAGNACAVAMNLVRRTSTIMRRIAGVPARAGIHRGNEL